MIVIERRASGLLPDSARIFRDRVRRMTPPTLLTPGRIDGFETRNRLFMAPMTRSRALAGGVPSELAIDYYAQRASAGLVLTEGVAPSAIGLVTRERPPSRAPNGSPPGRRSPPQ